MKPTEFAYELRRLTDGFSLQPLTDQRARALFDEYGSNFAEVVRRAIDNLLRGDRYPTASQITAAFVSAKLWDHEVRRRAAAAEARGRGANPSAVLQSLAADNRGDVDPRVPRFCAEVLNLFLNRTPPRIVAEFYRRYADSLPASLRLLEEADVLEGWGEHWPPGAPLFPVAHRQGSAAAQSDPPFPELPQGEQQGLPW